jgi:hypothetical protein
LPHCHFASLPFRLIAISPHCHLKPSRLTWGTSLRNCASLPQAQSKGYHVGVAII